MIPGHMPPRPARFARVVNNADRRIKTQLMSDEPKYTTTLLVDLLPRLLAENDNAVEMLRSGRQRGPISGFDKLDKTIGGYFQPGLHILQAAPGDGKTAMALQIASMCSFPSVYVSVEMPTIELFRRLIARSTDTFLGKLKSGELPTKKVQELALAAIENHPNFALVDATSGYIPLDEVQKISLVLKERFKSNNVFVVFDSLQYWARNISRGGLSEYDLISEGVRKLAEAGHTLSCPILAISHRNRAGNKGDGGMHASKGTGDIEYSCESLLELVRDPKEGKPDVNGTSLINLTVHKNRHGESGRTIQFEFSGRVQKFTEL